MNSNGYVPKPMDTSKVELPENLLELTEAIAKNVHEVWSTGRMSEGWTYGDKMDYENKKTPCLVPYEELPEEEKDYDRRTAMGTLKFIVNSGFKIEKE